MVSAMPAPAAMIPSSSRDVLQQAIAGEAKEEIAELRVIEVDFQQPVIGDGQHLAALYTFDRLRPSVIGCDKAKFAHQTTGRQFDADLTHEKFSRNR